MAAIMLGADVEESLKNLTVLELQQELKRRGLKRTGAKPRLIQRLKEAIENDEQQTVEKQTSGISEDAIALLHCGSSTSTPDSQIRVEEDEAVPEEENTTEKLGIIDDSLEQVQEKIESETDQNSFADMETRSENVDVLPRESITDHTDEPLPFKSDITDYEGSRTNGTDEISTVDDHSKVEAYYNEDANDKIRNADEEKDKVNDEENIQAETEDHGEINTSETDKADVDAEEAAEVSKEDKNSTEISEETKVDDDNLVATKDEVEMTEINQDDASLGFDVEPTEDDKAIVAAPEEPPSAEQQKKPEKLTKIIHQTLLEFDKKLSMLRWSTPVQIKKRKVPVGDTDVSQTSEVSPVPRKRRWGSSAKKTAVAISTDSLKTIIPEIKTAALDALIGFGLDDEDDKEEGEIDSLEGDEQRSVQSDKEDDENMEEVVEDAPEKKEPKRSGRKVRLGGGSTVRIGKSISVEQQQNDEEQPMVTEEILELKVPEERVSLLPEIPVEEPEEERERSPSPAKNPLCPIIHLRNLVRPFTLRQLRELLSKTGTVSDNGFWIDKIKSHCYVTYASEEEASTTREALHGKRWPAGSPKILNVDFATNDEMYRDTEGILGTATVEEKRSTSPDKEKRQKEREQFQENRRREREHREREREKQWERERENRLRDRERERERHQRQREGFETQEKISGKEDLRKKRDTDLEAPAKLLDDLFRKTKATPCIYWLPLTEEQIAAKQKEREDRRERRLKESHQGPERDRRDRPRVSPTKIRTRSRSRDRLR